MNFWDWWRQQSLVLAPLGPAVVLWTPSGLNWGHTKSFLHQARCSLLYQTLLQNINEGRDSEYDVNTLLPDFFNRVFPSYSFHDAVKFIPLWVSFSNSSPSLEKLCSFRLQLRLMEKKKKRGKLDRIFYPLHSLFLNNKLPNAQLALLLQTPQVSQGVILLLFLRLMLCGERRSVLRISFPILLSSLQLAEWVLLQI